MEDNNNNENNNPEQNNPGLTEDIRSEMTKLVNAAVTSHMSRQTKRFESMLTESLSSFAEQFKPAPQEAAPADAQADSETENKMRALHAQLQEERQRLEQEKTQRLVMEERTSLQAALTAKGVGPAQLKAAMALLYDAEKRVSRDSNGEIQFSIPGQGYTDHLSVAEGVEKFLGTEEGKMFLPPRDAAGSGNTGGQAPRSRQKAQSIDDLNNRDLISLFGEALEKGSADY